jgi:hypothetical protein
VARIQQAAGLQNPLQSVFPQPVVSNRAPTASDKNYPIGQEWIDKAGANAYILVNVSAGSATWNLAASTAGELNTLNGNSGTATPVSGAITISGGTNATSTASGSTVTVNVDSTLAGLTSVSSTSYNTNVVAAQITMSGTSILGNGTDAAVGIAITPKGTGTLALAGNANNVVTIGAANSGAVSVDSAAAISLDAATASNFTSSLASSAAAITISASAADGGITLDAGPTPGVTFTNGTQSHQMLVGTGTPNGTVTASQGSLYVDVAGSTSTTILFVNTDGATAWVGVGV